MASKPARSLRIGSLILLALALTLSSSALSDSPPQEPPPPTEVHVCAGDDGAHVQLSEGQILVISLESNPSTGYTWEVEHTSVRMEGQRILQQVGESEFRPQSDALGMASNRRVPHLLGAPGTQVLRFKAVEAGQTTFTLVYHRPWEQDVSPAGTYSLQVDAVGSFTSGGNTNVGGASESPPQSPLLAEDLSPLGLPSSYNWCDQGACTAVKNQGACGSCWAFSTVGPLESNILHYEGVTRDLSEQYLLSCNTDGWDCERGGWFAHDYHEWNIPPFEPEAGAVYEADFPYVAWDAPCNAPHTHHEKLLFWQYVDNSYSVPSIAAIKQAILDHGPVAAAVCVNSAFRDYSGGVFQGPECTDVNHAIVLVGWDDAQGAWILRNSWGTGWGESGYMRIEYGVSNVGYAANYVVYGLDIKLYFPLGMKTS